jgi:hypothetical protein
MGQGDITLQDLAEAFYRAMQKATAEFRPYDAQPVSYNRSGQVDLLRPCNGWTVVNKGTTNVTVNGSHVLAPDEFIAVSGNEREVFTGYLRLLFASNTDPGNNVIVWQKFYVTGASRYDRPNI